LPSICFLFPACFSAFFPLSPVFLFAPRFWRALPFSFSPFPDSRPRGFFTSSVRGAEKHLALLAVPSSPLERKSEQF
jgi:hypothetical protein